MCYRFIAKVVAIDNDTNKVKVHFAGWGSRFDEWVETNEQRLREAGPNAAERFHKKRAKQVNILYCGMSYYIATCMCMRYSLVYRRMVWQTEPFLSYVLHGEDSCAVFQTIVLFCFSLKSVIEFRQNGRTTDHTLDI